MKWKQALFALIAVIISGCTLVTPRSNMEIPRLSSHTIPNTMPRIETGFHIDTITDLSMDSEGEYMVSSSIDKTVRIWNLSDAKIVKTLQPPIGAGKEGMIYTVAISPNGRQIACAGWTGLDWGGKAWIYIFERSTGELIHKVDGLPNVVYCLSYSHDGKFLAATFGGKNGICIYNTTDYSLYARDEHYGASCHKAEFDTYGELATTCYDGFIRLYDKELQLIATAEAQSGKQPHGISFSPDGLNIAVGYADTPRVDVFDVNELTYLFSPDTGDLHSGNLANVTWSKYGTSLYAGGSNFNREFVSYVIRKWGKRGKGEFMDFPVAANVIQNLEAVSNGGIVYATSGPPSIGYIDMYGSKKVLQEAKTADFRNSYKSFRVSKDAKTIQFAYEQDKGVATFSISSWNLNFGRDVVLPPALTSCREMRISDWKLTDDPKLNDISLDIGSNELSYSMAIAPDKNSFILGSNAYLYLFAKDGEQLWKVATQAIPWSASIDGSGKRAVVAYGDGIIRWHRMSDGKVIASFFPHRDRMRWALWTPNGYFAASTRGGAKIIGEQRNKGVDKEGDFFRVPSNYRPDIVSEEIASCQIRERVPSPPPPKIEIIAKSKDVDMIQPEILISYQVDAPLGSVTKIMIYTDGILTKSISKGNRGLLRSLRSGKVLVKFPQKDCKISLVASTKYGNSEPESMNIKWLGSKVDLMKPKLYMLAIGINNYREKKLQLRFAAKDARDFVATMQKQKGGLYRSIECKLLTNELASRAGIQKGFEWIISKATTRDIAMVFLAGHGIKVRSGYYYLPYDTKIVAGQVKEPMATCIPFTDIKNTVNTLVCKTVFFIDSCHSGGALGKGRLTRNVSDMNSIVNELANAENGAVVFAASTGNQFSIEDASWGNGAFTKALVEGLNGKAAFMGKHKITITMLDAYISERVKELTNGEQTPATAKPAIMPDFPVALLQSTMKQ